MTRSQFCGCCYATTRRLQQYQPKRSSSSLCVMSSYRIVYCCRHQSLGVCAVLSSLHVCSVIIPRVVSSYLLVYSVTIGQCVCHGIITPCGAQCHHSSCLSLCDVISPCIQYRHHSSCTTLKIYRTSACVKSLHCSSHKTRLPYSKVPNRWLGP